MVPLSRAQISVQPTSAFIAIKAKVDARISKLPFSQRMTVLEQAYNEIESSSEDFRARRVEKVVLHSTMRGIWPTVWRLYRSEDDPKGFDRSPATLRARFICYGDGWPRARQTSEYLRLGGAKADVRVQVWYALFPYMYGPRLDWFKELGRVAARFPDRWEPLLVRYGYIRTLYRDWTIRGGIRRGAVPLATHKEARADVDAAFRITTKTYGPDRRWNDEYNRALDEARALALKKGMPKS